MAAEKVTVKNSFTGKLVDVPAPGKIVKVTFHENVYYRDKKPREKEITGIVLVRKVNDLGNVYIRLLDLEGRNILCRADSIVKATATRSLTPEARDALKGLYKWHVIEEPKWRAKIAKLTAERDAAAEAVGASNPKAFLARCMGGVSDAEFESMVLELLAKKVPAISRGRWYVTCYQKNVIIMRDEDICRYYKGGMSYLEYDDGRTLMEDCEKTPEGQRLIKRHRISLPLKGKFEEHFELGDKNTLIYVEKYELGHIDGVPSREAAEKLVSKVLK